MSSDGFLACLTRAARPACPWLRIATNSPWWTRVLLAAGAQRWQLPKDFVGRADFHAGLLEQADLTNADLAHAYLAHASLTRAELTGAILTGANLTRAILVGAILTRANLNGAMLTGEELTGANLTGVDLTGANLSESLGVEDAFLVNVVWSERTRWPAGLAAGIRERSEPLGGGRWRIMGSGNAGAETEAPLVPVG